MTMPISQNNALPAGEGPGAVDTLREIVLLGQPAADAVGVTANELEALYVLAYRTYQREDFVGARTLFARLVQLNHMDPRFLMGLGGCEQMLGHYTQALLQYVAAGMADPADPTPLLYSAKCLIELNAPTEAREALLMACARADEAGASEVSDQARNVLNDLEINPS